MIEAYRLSNFVYYMGVLLLSLHVIGSGSQRAGCETIQVNSNLRTEHESDASEIEVTFQNRGNAQIELFWLSAAGVENSMGVLEPHDESALTSYTGHAFRARLLSTSDTIYEVLIKETTASVKYEVGKGCSDVSTTFDGLDISTNDYKFHSQKSITMIPDVEAVRKAMKFSPCKDIQLSDWISRKLAVPGYMFCV
jgi:hypothetical protein